jgi:hypothetical protein
VSAVANDLHVFTRWQTPRLAWTKLHAVVPSASMEPHDVELRCGLSRPWGWTAETWIVRRTEDGILGLSRSPLHMPRNTGYCGGCLHALGWSS